MLTQEERLTALERFQKQVAEHIQASDENLTILPGVIRSQGQDIRRLVEQGYQHADLLRAHPDLLNEHTALLHQILSRLEKE